MLDLKRLEEKLNVALAKETEDSLSQWLNSKRNKNMFNNLGLGQFESKKALHGQFFVSSGSYSVHSKAENVCDISSVSFLLAA